jgi:hypothetical protein
MDLNIISRGFVNLGGGTISILGPFHVLMYWVGGIYNSLGLWFWSANIIKVDII